MSPDGFKTQVLLLHNDQGTLDELGSEFDLRYTVHFATSGSQALQALAEAPIDIFISAGDLPGMSGLETLREAKNRSPQTLGILLTDATADEGAVTDGDEIFQTIRGNVTGEALFELVENASKQMRLPMLSRSANDATAQAGNEPQHIVMATADDGSPIVSQSSARLRALDPKSLAAVSPVDILVLTKDTTFLETIRSSSNNVHKVHAATGLPEANDIMRNHKVGVAIVDAAIVREKIEHLTQYLRRESPRLVSIVAGRRDDGEMLIDLVNRGNVYRFLLKPVSSGRARLALAASVKHHLDGPDSAFTRKDDATDSPPAATEANDEAAGEPGEEQPEPAAANSSTAKESLSKTGAYRMAELAAAAAKSDRPARTFGKIPVIGATVAVLAIAATVAFVLGGRSAQNVEPQAAIEPVAIAPATTETDVVLSPPAVEQLINAAETALLDSRLRDADDALQRVSSLDPANARLPFLTAQLAQARLRLHLNEARAAIRDERFEDAADALSAAQPLAAVSGSTEIEALTAELDGARSKQQTDALLALANASLEAGDLVSPPNDNARYYYESVLWYDPENLAAQQGLVAVEARESAMAALAAANLAEADEGPLAAEKEAVVEADDVQPPGSEAVVEADDVQPPGSEAVVEADDVQPPGSEAVATETVVKTEYFQADEITPSDGIVVPEAIATDSPDPVSSPDAEEELALEETPVAVSSLVRTNYVAPKYPRNAVRRNLSGWVDVEFTVSIYGTVKDAEARASEPSDVFVESAIRAVEQWQFEPVLSNGVVTERRASVRMMFSLN